jgi:Glycine-rich domain
MKIIRFLRLGVILPQPGQLRPDSSNSYGLDALVSNVNTYAVTLIDLSQSGTNITLTGPQALAGVVRLVGAASGNFTVTLPPTPRLIDALGPTVPRDGSYAVEISIQNEDPTFDATLTAGDSSTTINGTAIVVAGTRRIWLMTVGTPYDYNVVSIQNIGTFSATAVTPTGGTVTSVGQTVPVEFTVSGSPVTTSGTLAISKANENANTVWAGPTTGAAAEPTFRSLVLADLPGGVGAGSVTSVGLSMPAEFSVASSPVTTSGTIAVTKATESANTVWAGPTSGAPAQPAFRALVTADLPASLGLTQTFITLNAESSLTNSRHLVAGSNITLTDTGSGGTLTIASTASGSGGTLQSQAFTVSGTWTPPTGVTAAWIWMVGAGGGGGGASSASTSAGGGGGAGELVENFMVPVSGAVTVTIGAAGTAGINNTNGGDGGNTSFGSFVALGGKHGAVATVNGAGGGVKAGTTSGQMGSAETNTFFGGGAGGAGGAGASGGNGAGTGGQFVGGAGGSAVGGNGGGGGGAATLYGEGGAGGSGGANNGAAGIGYGAGGGGGGANNGGGVNTSGGAGAAGYCVVYWVS